MWELDSKESWVLRNWCFWTVVLEKTLESPLDCKEIKPVNCKEIQSWIFIGRTNAAAETPILWLPDVKNWLIGKDPDAGNDWRQEEKGTTEDRMVGWHHWLNGHELSKLQELVMDRETWHAAIHGVARVRHNWTTELTDCLKGQEALADIWVIGSSLRSIENTGEEEALHYFCRRPCFYLKPHSRSVTVICLIRMSVLAKSLQSCPTLCNRVDCSPPDSSVHGVLQVRILKWVTMPSSRGSSHPRDWTQVFCIADGFFTVWATRETLLYHTPLWYNTFLS